MLQKIPGFVQLFSISISEASESVDNNIMRPLRAQCLDHCIPDIHQWPTRAPVLRNQALSEWLSSYTEVNSLRMPNSCKKTWTLCTNRHKTGRCMKNRTVIRYYIGCHRLQTTGSRPRAPDHRLQTSNYTLECSLLNTSASTTISIRP